MQLGEEIIDKEEITPNRWNDSAHIMLLKNILLKRNEVLLEAVNADPVFFIERRFIPLTI